MGFFDTDYYEDFDKVMKEIKDLIIKKDEAEKALEALQNNKFDEYLNTKITDGFNKLANKAKEWSVNNAEKIAYAFLAKML